MARFDVLVVDDDDATRDGLRELLTRAGFDRDDAHDGAAALEKIDRNDFGVVLLDVQLPGVGGLDVLARCVEKQTPSKIIVMTGVGTTETVLAALRGQAYEFIPKPIEPWRLVESSNGRWRHGETFRPSRYYRRDQNGSSCWCPARARRSTESRALCNASRPICLGKCASRRSCLSRAALEWH